MPKKFSSYKSRIDAFLIDFLRQKKKSLSQVNQWGTLVTDHLEAFLTSGKSIRGSLVLWFDEMYGNSNQENALIGASALELFHGGLLVHDDIMDNDESRRGSESVYKQFDSFRSQETSDPTYTFGKNLAICIADLCFFLGSSCLSHMSADTGSENIIPLVSGELSDVCLAQMLDVSRAENPEIPDSAEILKLYEYKTGRYSMSLPMRIGTMLEHQPVSESDKITELGKLIGSIFQIRDDELNLFGQTQNTGKPVGSDIREAKKTLYITTLYEMAEPTVKNEIRKLLIRTGSDTAAGERIYSLLEEYHIKEKISVKMDSLLSRSNEIIRSLSLSDENKKEISEFADFIRFREV
jgi:geranylgeranyl diphosphate synthase type I